MSQTCNLPEEANLWNVHDAYTIVATQRGARRDFQKKLAMKGVEVVEFDMLNPRDVMSYCYDRGYLSVLWECGGTLSAAAISARVIHKVNVFLFHYIFAVFIYLYQTYYIVSQNVYLLPLFTLVHWLVFS
jgi:diaminohydroxyphosphoribosylaminopyrimidine deaminase/5-amino-6-(5-phosphoribosylamino)uracil reductase